MKAWKFLVLLGGIAGVAGFFLPFFSFTAERENLTVSVSAYQIVSGIDAVDELIDGAKPIAAADANAREALATVNAELERYRTALVVVFAPAVALALLGALAGARRKMGRIAGLVALALGAANAGIWYLFYSVAVDEPDMTVELGYGLHLILVAGGLAILAGLGAIFSPDRGQSEA